MQLEQLEQHIDRALRELLGPTAPRWTLVAQLSGGYTNLNCLLDLAGTRVVLRLARPAARFLAIDRERELTMLKLAAQNEIGAPVIAANVASGNLLTRFIEGVSEAERLQTERPQVDLLANVLRRVHRLRVDVPVSDPRDLIRRYLSVAAAANTRLPESMPAWRQRLDHVGFVPSTLVHHDVNPWNVIHGASQSYLIDWEYAARGDAAFDLAGVAALWRLSTSEMDALLTAYAADQHLRQRVGEMAWVFHLREYSWAVAMLALADTLDPGVAASIRAQATAEEAWLVAHE